MRNGKIAETNYVWPSPWFLSNYYYRYTRPFDFEFYKRLRKPIAKSLYPLLENGWYAAEGKPYAKSYLALCEEFLLKRHAHLSRIKQQLDPSHSELAQEGFLGQWDYRLSARGNDYILETVAGRPGCFRQPVPHVRCGGFGDALPLGLLATCPAPSGR